MLSDIDMFVQYLQQSERSPLTIKNYRCDLEAFGKWFDQTNGESLRVASITPTDLREYKQYLSEQQPSRDGHKGLKPNSINRKLATLKSFLKWAVEAELISPDPILRLPKMKRQQKGAPRWLDKRELHRLVRAVEKGGNFRDIAVIAILLNTGLRVSELTQICWYDVRLSERKGTITIRNGKGDKQRIVPLNRDAREAFKSLGYVQHQGRLPVFTGQRGQMTSRGVQTMLAKYAHQARLEDVSPHVLRHTFCKSLLDANCQLTEVAEIAGHEDLNTTRMYCRPSPMDLQKAVAQIELA